MEKLKRRRGRPRIYPSGAARQRAYRNRKKITRLLADADPLVWNTFLAEHGLSVNAGRFIKNAPASCGLLHSGGNSSAVLDALETKQSTNGSCGHGHRVSPKGHGPSNSAGDPTGYVEASKDFGQIVQEEMAAADIEDAERRLRYVNQTSKKP